MESASLASGVCNLKYLLHYEPRKRTKLHLLLILVGINLMMTFRGSAMRGKHCSDVVFAL